MFQSDLCNNSDAYIVIKGTITVADPNNNAHYRELAFKYNVLYISCLSKINYTLINNAEDSDIVMPIYNLISTAKIIQRHQEAYGIIIEMEQVVVQ